MKPATPALVTLINSVIAGTASMHDFDLYTITLFGGGTIKFTTADFDINCGTGTNFGGLPQPSGVYSSGGIRVDQLSSKTQSHWKAGLDSDQWVVVLMPRPVDLVTGAAFPDMIGSVPWLQAAQGGALDAADVQVDRAYFASMPTWPMPPGGAVPIGTITIFAGTVAEVDTTNSVAVMTINDYRSLLSYNMPRHFFQGMCRHQLYDVGCNANGNMVQSTFAVNSKIAAGSSGSTLLAPGIATPSGSGTFTLGSLQMTSGLNDGFWRTIVEWDGQSTLDLLNPLPFALAVGDTFTAYPGCDKLATTCALFNNTPQFGGEPEIPVPETIIAGGA